MNTTLRTRVRQCWAFYLKAAAQYQTGAKIMASIDQTEKQKIEAMCQYKTNACFFFCQMFWIVSLTLGSRAFCMF